MLLKSRRNHSDEAAMAEERMLQHLQLAEPFTFCYLLQQLEVGGRYLLRALSWAYHTHFLGAHNSTGRIGEAPVHEMLQL